MFLFCSIGKWKWKNVYLAQSTLQKCYINKNYQHYLTQHTRKKNVQSNIVLLGEELLYIILTFASKIDNAAH